ncbi:CTR copper uptake transporter [Suillus fuscotomentosus]|uniref:Copper transport protein n=1 Tax=Suillus fuscotomentosus TaxID=1912939 RepID=A0AAD4DU75_9AGAM|nr:CTR copper uptake transporter [Suillus fuscotomentosus]KAG1893842.1 CTR copper uptake transporter [Suillus fuscotomentosus]
MVMSMDDGMTLAVGNMLSYLHFTQETLVVWFLGWVPKSSGAMVGTCFALFMLAMIERWIVACRGVMEFHWSQQYILFLLLSRYSTNSHFTPPFIPAHDISRGVMTFQLGFILSLVVGLGVGETLFGRFGSVTHAH